MSSNPGAIIRVTLLSTLMWSAAAQGHAQPYDPSARDTYSVDEIGRVVGVPGRREIRCPPQTSRTAVLLIAGQSNAASYAETRYRTARPNHVVNYFDGRCYPAASPLLGADGRRGESWTPLAERLVEAGVFERVVIVTTAMGSTPISRWRKGGDLNLLLRGVTRGALRRYRVTHVLWHQGETDVLMNTSRADYAAGLAEVVETLRDDGVKAPVFVSVASKCTLTTRPEAWGSTDPVMEAQRAAPDPGRGIFAGPDTNALVAPSARSDGCHFAAAGQRIFAEAWFEILRNHQERSGAAR